MTILQLLVGVDKLEYATATINYEDGSQNDMGCEIRHGKLVLVDDEEYVHETLENIVGAVSINFELGYNL